MATINAAECFGLGDKGAIAPGYKADFILLDDLKSIAIADVYKDGKIVIENGMLVNDWNESLIPKSDLLKKTVRFAEVTKRHFDISLTTDKANIIQIIPNSLVTRHIIEEVRTCEQGLFQPSTVADQLKLAVIERHHGTNQIGLGIVKGLGFTSGAIATTIAHDSHNLIIAGTNDHDMAVAANAIKKMQGGLIVVNHGEVIASLELPIAGLMSDRPYHEVYSSLNDLHLALKKLGANEHFNPFLTISFLALPVIPELKLTDKGLFQVSKFKHIHTHWP